MKRTVGISLSLLAGAAALYWGMPTGIPLRYRVDDVIRLVVLAQSLFGLCMAAMIIADVGRMKVDERDTFVCYLRWDFIAFILFGAYASLDVLSMLGVGYLTWKAPLAFVAFGIADYGLYGTLRQVRQWVRAAVQVDAVVKIAVLDTSKPGDDVPLKDEGEA